MTLKNLLNNDITQEEYLNYKNTTLLFRKLPIEKEGMIFRRNDIQIILINSNLDYETQKKVFLHELIHLEKNHTYKYKYINDDVTIFEDEVDEYLNVLLNK